MVKQNFTEWVDTELAKRSWTRAELSRRANVSQSTLSMVWSGERQPGAELCVAIAHALNFPPETIFRAAGLLPALPEEDAEWEIWRERVRHLSPENRERFSRMIDAELQFQRDQEERAAAQKRKR